MLFSLLRFEAKYQFKQKAFVGFGAIFLLFGLLLGNQGFAVANVNFNAAYQISYNIALLSLGCVFAIMFFTISGMLRDRQYGFEPLIFSTSIQKLPFFFSRFSGTFLFGLLVFSMGPVGFALGTFMPNMDPERLGAFQIGFYIWTWLIFVLPNIFICTTVIFAVCSLTKSTVATYISAVLIYALYWICSIFLNSPLLANSVPASPEGLAIAALADPFGISAFFEQTQFWTPYQKNGLLVSFSGNFMWNRILWLSVSLALLATTYKLYSFRLVNHKNKKILIEEEIKRPTAAYSPIDTLKINTQTQWQPFFSLLKMEFNGVFKSLPFLAVILIWVVVSTTEIHSALNGGGNYGDSPYPTANFLMGRIREPLLFLGLLLIVFYSGELVWRERSFNINGIIDATPAKNSVFFLSKAVTLLLLPILLIVIGITIALGFQIYKGYFEFGFWRYLSEFHYSGFALFFYMLMALFVQGLAHKKYLGMVISCLVIVLFGSQMAVNLGMEHPLLHLGNMSDVDYTEMTGYGDTAKPFHYYAVHWGALGLLLSLVSFKLWQRGSVHTFRFRMKQFLSNWKKWQRFVLVFLGTVFLISGAIIYYNTNFLNEYTTVKEDLDLREAYERKYKKFENLTKPVLADVKTRMDIFPDKESFVLQADNIIENISGTPICEVLVSERVLLDSIQLENAQLMKYDTYLQTYRYKLNTPLLPGQQLKFSYKIAKEQKGFEINKGLAKNGSYLVNYDFEPVLGYRDGLEIKNNFEREKRGLPKRTEETLNEDDLQNNRADVYKRIGFETILSTSFKQTAVAPGDLINQWQKNGRNYYHYRTSRNIMPSIAYFSAAYKSTKEEYNGISIEQYYDSRHFYNIQDIQETTKATLEYCIKNFGQYPFHHLRIAEIPSHWGFGGYAHPGTISMVGNRLYLTDNRNPKDFDLVSKRTVHEIAHQYWGHTLSPKNIDGASLFTEGLAKYTEAVVMEKMHGKGAVFQLGKTANKDYFRGRSFAVETEPPLYFAKGQSYLSYGKSYTVMLSLKELLGEATVNLVLRDLLEKHRNDSIPNAISSELITGFMEVSPKKYHQLINDWFKRVITYDLKIENSVTEKLTNGKYEITLDIFAKRFETKSNGETVEIPIDEPIQIGAFTKHPSQLNEDSAILYLHPQRIYKEHQQIKFRVDKLPRYITIDPFGTRLDANRVDNIREF